MAWQLVEIVDGDFEKAKVRLQAKREAFRFGEFGIFKFSSGGYCIKQRGTLFDEVKHEEKR